MPDHASSIALTVYLVGSDPDDAATSMPFTDRQAADRARDEQQPDGDPLRVFSTAAALDLSTLTPIDDDPVPARRGAARAIPAPGPAGRPVLYRCCGIPGPAGGHALPRPDIGLVGLDAAPAFPAWWDDRDRWNGWLNPGFTRAAAETVVAWIDRCHTEHPDATDRLEWRGDTIVHHQPAYEDEPGYAPETIHPSTDGRYFIGGYSWTWSKVGELPSRIDRIVAEAKAEIRRDAASGRVPASVSAFDELHDHVDANEYGGLCDPDRAADLSHRDNVTVQDRVNAWLQTSALSGHTAASHTPTDLTPPSPTGDLVLRGCSCGEAHHGDPGHDGGPSLPSPCPTAELSDPLGDRGWRHLDSSRSRREPAHDRAMATTVEITWVVCATVTYSAQLTLGELLTGMDADDAVRVRAALAAGHTLNEALGGQAPACLPDRETCRTEIDYDVHERFITEVTIGAGGTGPLIADHRPSTRRGRPVPGSGSVVT